VDTRHRKPAVSRGYGDGLGQAIELIAAPVVLALVGLFIDSRLGTAPLFFLIFLVFGAAGSFAAAYYRYRDRSAALDKDKPWTRRAGRT
jgi:F0F1-type ATP synthase assembly protein I